MANLIDNTYFQGLLTIAQKTEAANAASLTVFISQIESQFLKDLLGYELYKDFKDGIAVTPTPDPIWTDLRDGKEYTNEEDELVKWDGLLFTIEGVKRSPIANYIYYRWLKKEATNTTGTGEKKFVQGGVVDYSPWMKMQDAWNEMAQWNRNLANFLDHFDDVYPQFDFDRSNQLYYPINHLGI